ncbi:MAG: ATP-binding protein [Methanobacteriota archaeon]
MDFFGRQQELGLMNELYSRGGGILVITGRRRVGKTAMVRQFIQDKPSIYLFVDAHKKIDLLLKEFTSEIVRTLHLPSYVHFSTSTEIIRFLLSYKQPIVVVFDEFQRFYQTYPAFYSELQNAWDTRDKDCKTMLILTGSSIGMMERVFMDGGAPLFKRADTILRLKPFRPNEIFSVMQQMSVPNFEEKINLYFLFGGMIHYYQIAERFSCFTWNDVLQRLIFSEYAPLRSEPAEIMVEEFGGAHATYYEILAAIAEGKHTAKEISDFAAIAQTSVWHYLDQIIRLLGIIEYRAPVTENRTSSKKGRYVLIDHFLKFYARYVYRFMSLYESGQYAWLSDHTRKDWASYCGHAFEDLIREMISILAPDTWLSIGSWWDRRGNEIDLVAIGPSGSLLIECKHRMVPMNEASEILARLTILGEQIPGLIHPFRIGIAAEKIEGREKFTKSGHIIIEYQDLEAILS